MKRKTSATPANESRSSKCKKTRRLRLAESEAKKLERDIQEVTRQLQEVANDPNLWIITGADHVYVARKCERNRVRLSKSARGRKLLAKRDGDR